MPLYDVTHKDIYVDPEEAEQYELIQNLMNKLHAGKFKAIVRIVDEAIDSVKPTKSTALVWTRTGALFGHSSTRPLKDINYLWDTVIDVVGEGKVLLKTVGALMRWRTAMRPEKNWLVYRQETDKLDPDTGKPITASEYWICEDYKPKVKKKVNKNKPATLVDVSKLKKKWR